jgi:replication factor A1
MLLLTPSREVPLSTLFSPALVAPPAPQRLTRASVIFNDPDKAAKLFPVPVMQCLQIKQMAPSAQGGDRYRLVMSDGEHYVQTMLGTQGNHVVHEGKLQRGSIARVKQYTPNNVKGKKCVLDFL